MLSPNAPREWRAATVLMLTVGTVMGSLGPLVTSQMRNLCEVAKNEIGGINIAMLNLRAFSMTEQEAKMKIAATQIQEACERIRIGLQRVLRPGIYPANRLSRKEVPAVDCRARLSGEMPQQL
jgi:hypothetical protein